MDIDEQEAKSFQYVMPRAMRLSSGRFALLVDGQEPLICDGHTLLSRLPSSDEIEAYHQSFRASRPKAPVSGKLTTLDLADLGL